MQRECQKSSGGGRLGLICGSCKREYAQDLEAPAAWASKHPDLKGLCPACVFARLNEIMMEET